MGADSDASLSDADEGGTVADKRRRVGSVDTTAAGATSLPPTHVTASSTSPQFSGRQSELNVLHTLNTSLSPQPLTGVVVSGFGGIGKTEFVRFYARTYFDYFGGNCVWIHAENVIAMRNSFLKLLKEQAHVDWGAIDISNQDLAQKCYKFFEGKRAVFTFDNAENYAAVKEFLPAAGSKQRGHVHVFTSRSEAPEDWSPDQFANLALGVLTLEDSVDFLRKALSPWAARLPVEQAHIQAHWHDYKSLAEELGCYPLALTQAAAYIAKENSKFCSLPYAISGFLHAFKLNDSAMELLDYKFWEAACEGGACRPSHAYEKTLYTVLELSLAKIRSSCSCTSNDNDNVGVVPGGGPTPNVGHFSTEILYRLAFCGADKVPLALFLHNWPPSFDQNAMGDQECVWRAVELLRRYSMITVQEDRYISVHRLFQRIVRAHARGQELKYISSLREMMSPYITPSKTDNPVPGHGPPAMVDPDQRLFIAHALQLCKYTFEYQEPLLRFLHQNRNIASFVHGLVDFHAGAWALLCQHEFYQEALELAIASAALYAQGPAPLLGPGSEPALAMRLRTGRTYTKQHFCYKTHDEYRGAYELALQHLGADHELTLDLMCHLAWILSQPCLNDRGQARVFYQQCYDRALPALGPLHRITVLAKAGIGSVESLDDRQTQALAELQDVITFDLLLDDILDDESYRIVFTNLQKVYTALGQHTDAYDASDRIVRRLETKYGPLAIPTLIAKVNLVERLLDLRDFRRTREVLDTIYAEAQQRLGENRLAFLELREHAATLARETGPESAQDWVRHVYEDVLTRKKTTLAFNEERHESVIWTEFKVSELHFRRREYDKALEVGRRVEAKLARLWGEGHGSTCKVKKFLATVQEFKDQVTGGVWAWGDAEYDHGHGQRIMPPMPPIDVDVLVPTQLPEPPTPRRHSHACSESSTTASCASTSGASLMSPEMEPVEGPMDTMTMHEAVTEEEFQFEREMKVQFDIEKLTCSVPPCDGRIFSLRNVFVRHMGNSHHINLYRDKRKERVFTCPYCEKKCGRADNLRSHIKKRHGGPGVDATQNGTAWSSCTGSASDSNSNPTSV